MSFRGIPTYLSDLIADTITGAIIQTATSGARWVINSQAAVNQILGYTGDPRETSPGGLFSGIDGRGNAYVGLKGTTLGTQQPASLTLYTAGSDAAAVESSPEWGVQVPGVGGNNTVLGGLIPVSISAASDGMRIGPETTTPINGIDFGAKASALTGSAGGYIVNHNLGVVPTTILATPFTSSNAMAVRVGARTTGNFTLQFYNPSTGADLALTNVGFFWAAIA